MRRRACAWSCDAKADGGRRRLSDWPRLDSAVPKENAVKKNYTKPVIVQLGNVANIKSNSTGPSSDGQKYAGFFK